MIEKAHDRDSVRVLIVEDVERLREMLLRALRDMEFVPTAVGSGETGLAAIKAQNFDIAVVDLNLPGMNGLEFCEQVHRVSEQTQLIILTGYGDLEAAQRAMRLDVVDFLTKPCALDDLEVSLARALRRRQAPGSAAAAPLQTAIFDESDEPGPEPRTMEEIERKHILEALARNDGNRAKTAEDLGISLRTLYYRLSAYERRGSYTRERDDW
jgi:DNA-binding NtrC family response regulator